MIGAFASLVKCAGNESMFGRNLPVKKKLLDVTFRGRLFQTVFIVIIMCIMLSVTVG